MLTEQSVIDALKTVYDPEIPVNIYDLGLIYEVKVTGADVAIVMTLTTATCPAAAFMPEEIKNVVYEIKGVEKVKVEVVYEPKWTREKMSPKAKSLLGFA